MLDSLAKFADGALLLGRTGLGVLYVLHGWPKLAAGAPTWTKLGHAMTSIGITFLPQMWGLFASLSEFLGGMLLVLGLLFRPACICLGFTMFVAFASVYQAGHNFGDYSRPLEMLFVFVVLACVGPGKYSCDRR